MEAGSVEEVLWRYPVEKHPDSQTTMWEYPERGIQFIHINSEGTASYTLKLVQPKG